MPHDRGVKTHSPNSKESRIHKTSKEFYFPHWKCPFAYDLPPNLLDRNLITRKGRSRRKPHPNPSFQPHSVFFFFFQRRKHRLYLFLEDFFNLLINDSPRGTEQLLIKTRRKVEEVGKNAKMNTFPFLCRRITLPSQH